MVHGKWSVKFVAPLVCLLVAMSLVVVCGCGESTKETYDIGVVVSLSGPASPLGQPEQRALELFEEKINGEGGVDGHKINFIFEDDESEPSKASTAVTKLISQENVPVVIGSSSSGATLAMKPVTEKNEIPQVCLAANTSITQPVDEAKWIFRTPPSDSMAITKVMEYLQDGMKVERIAILHDANAFGTGGADEIEEKAPDYDIDIVKRESYGSTDTDMTGQLSKIAETDAEAIVVWGTNPGPASIAKNMQEMNMTLPYVGSHGIANKKFIELAGDAANGVVFPAGRLLIPESIDDPDWKAAVEEFAQDYKEAYDMDIDTFAAHGWDGGLIVTEAMKKAGTDSSKIRDEIESIKDLVGIDGIYTFSAKDHDGLSPDDLIMIKIENGEWTYHQYEKEPVD